jgi:uncharacterized membrane protein YcaP (DUF421 family)
MMQLKKRKNIFNICGVEFAVIESDKKLSVLPKLNKQPITANDLCIAVNFNELLVDLIIDSKLLI